MRRRATALLVLVAAGALLSGCGISLFSRTSEDPESERRAAELERRMERIEQELQSRPAR